MACGRVPPAAKGVVDKVGFTAMHRFLRTVLVGLLLAFGFGARLAVAEPFADVTPSQWALTSVPEHLEAPAVVLDKRARLQWMDGGQSRLDVSVRLKVLTEAGKSFGQVVVGHGAAVRMVRFEGRTVLPNGTVVPLPEASLFRESRVAGNVTKAAFPAVEVGAVIDYRFRLQWDSIYFLEPWYLDDRVPTLHSELTYVEPAALRIDHNLRDSGNGHVQTQERVTAHGREVTLQGTRLPAVVEEPFGPVFADLALRVMVVPTARLAGDGSATPLLDDWRSVALVAEQGYATARRFSRRVRKIAKAHVSGIEGDVARTNALLALTRERVSIREGAVFVGADASLDRALDRGAGSPAEVALVLETMLDAVGIKARLAWAGDWRGGFPDLKIINPGWFQRVLVRTEPDGRWLDPGDRRLAPGRLAPTQEGTAALLIDGTRSRVVPLPRSPAAESRRRAELIMDIDEDGRVAGSGQLTLRGHHAWFYLDRFEAEEATRAAWQRWVEQHLEGFAISDVRVQEQRDVQTILIAWRHRQHESDVLGDEVTLLLSRPFGPLRQRYGVPAEDRRTPVLLSFADLDEIETRITWPTGWSPEIVPDAWANETSVGLGAVSFEIADDGGSGIYRRQLRIDTTRVEPPRDYEALRSLRATMERSDAQPLVLVLE